MSFSGIERFISPDELFFSTTDRRGLIRSGNSVFVRVSGFSLDELTGAPHSIVRHPGMPAGAFRLIWERLLHGRPAGAYVRNLAKDGSHYWVFATMTPSPDGFLSVRVAPRTPLADEVKRLYKDVADVELEAAARDGATRRDVARAGQERLEELLGEMGFGSHDVFLTEALTGEVVTRGRLASAVYARSRRRGPIAEVLAGAGALASTLADLVLRLEDYRQLSERLLRSFAEVLAVARRLDRAIEAAQTASAAVAATAPVLHNTARVMAVPAGKAVAALERLAPRLASLRSDVADLRLGIALASLHTDMIAAFAAEVLDGVAPPTSLGEVPLLCDVVHGSVLDLSARAGRVNQALREVVAEVAEAGERLAEFHRFLGQWRLLVLRRRAGAALGDLVRPIDDEFAASWDGMDMLRSLSAEFEASAVPFDVAELEERVMRIRADALAYRDAS
ncbi:PAS domain-containing protein [Nonomuraea pusilla]|uniref:PAS domain-containing protein n=1 Tax=Nonomuraea pusilla TaxID=46177 RepID=UPI00331D258C